MSLAPQNPLYNCKYLENERLLVLSLAAWDDVARAAASDDGREFSIGLLVGQVGE
jgi:hypothetical protein